MHASPFSHSVFHTPSCMTAFHTPPTRKTGHLPSGGGGFLEFDLRILAFRLVGELKERAGLEAQRAGYHQRREVLDSRVEVAHLSVVEATRCHDLVLRVRELLLQLQEIFVSARLGYCSETAKMVFNAAVSDPPLALAPRCSRGLCRYGRRARACDRLSVALMSMYPFTDSIKLGIVAGASTASMSDHLRLRDCAARPGVIEKQHVPEDDDNG